MVPVAAAVVALAVMSAPVLAQNAAAGQYCDGAQENQYSGCESSEIIILPLPDGVAGDTVSQTREVRIAVSGNRTVVVNSKDIVDVANGGSAILIRAGDVNVIDEADDTPAAEAPVAEAPAAEASDGDRPLPEPTIEKPDAAVGSSGNTGDATGVTVDDGGKVPGTSQAPESVAGSATNAAAGSAADEAAGQAAPETAAPGGTEATPAGELPDTGGAGPLPVTLLVALGLVASGFVLYRVGFRR